MVGVGLISFIAQILLTVSLQLEEAGKVSIMRKSGDILFAFLFQITIFNVRQETIFEYFDMRGEVSVFHRLRAGLADFIRTVVVQKA